MNSCLNNLNSPLLLVLTTHLRCKIMITKYRGQYVGTYREGDRVEMSGDSEHF